MSSEMLFKRTKQRTYKRKRQGRADWWVFMPKVAIFPHCRSYSKLADVWDPEGIQHQSTHFGRRTATSPSVEPAVTTSCLSRTTRRIHNSNQAKRQVTTSITTSVRYRLIGSWSRLGEGQMSVVLWFHTTCFVWTARSCRSISSYRRVLAASTRVLAASSRVLAASSRVLAASSRVLAASSRVLAASSRVLAARSKTVYFFRSNLCWFRSNNNFAWALPMSLSSIQTMIFFLRNDNNRQEVKISSELRISAIASPQVH